MPNRTYTIKRFSIHQGMQEKWASVLVQDPSVIAGSFQISTYTFVNIYMYMYMRKHV